MAAADTQGCVQVAWSRVTKTSAQARTNYSCRKSVQSFILHGVLHFWCHLQCLPYQTDHISALSCCMHEFVVHNAVKPEKLLLSYLIDHTDPPKCTNCNQILSVELILTEFTLYGQTRHQYYSFTDNHTPSQIYWILFLKNEILHKLYFYN